MTKNSQKCAKSTNTRNIKSLITNTIYSFDFSCFHGIVPGLGTTEEKEVTDYHSDIVTSFLFVGTLTEL